jgi:hypothetical protein
LPELLSSSGARSVIIFQPSGRAECGFDDIQELPETRRERNDIVEVCIKHFKYLAEKLPSNLSEQEEDFMKTMQEIDAIYKFEMNQAEVRGQYKQAYSLIFRQLARRVGNVSIDLQEKIKFLPLEKLETLSEDLLIFSQSSDLLTWLERNE